MSAADLEAQIASELDLDDDDPLDLDGDAARPVTDADALDAEFESLLG